MTGPGKFHPVPEGDVHVEGDTIYRGTAPFAQLRFYFSLESSKNAGETYLFNAPIQHRGIAIYYFKEERLAWIFPGRGLDKDIERGHYSARGQSDGYFGWVFDVAISQDGKYIYYKKPGLLYPSSYRYSVERGVLD